MENGKVQTYSKEKNKDKNGNDIFKQSKKSYGLETCKFIIETLDLQHDWQDKASKARLVIYAPERQNIPLHIYAHPKELQRFMA